MVVAPPDPQYVVVILDPRSVVARRSDGLWLVESFVNPDPALVLGWRFAQLDPLCVRRSVGLSGVL